MPPSDVTARQEGDAAVAAFTAPQPRGEKPSQTPMRAELVRVEYRPGLHPPPDAGAFRRRGTVVATFAEGPIKPGARIQIKDPSIAQLEGGGVGWTLRYGVRVLDRRGRPSPLVVATDLVPVAPPPPPRGLRGEATADGVRLTWSPPTPEGEYKFNVYRAAAGEPWGERPLNNAPLRSPEYLDPDIVPGHSYRYEVRTAAADELPYRESSSSEPCSVLAQDVFPPTSPTGLIAVQEGAAVRLFWNPGAEKDLAGYRLYRKVGEGEWARVGPEIMKEPTFLDTDVHPGQHLGYRVTAVDRAGNESTPSAQVELDVAEEAGSERKAP